MVIFTWTGPYRVSAAVPVTVLVVGLAVLGPPPEPEAACVLLFVVPGLAAAAVGGLATVALGRVLNDSSTVRPATVLRAARMTRLMQSLSCAADQNSKDSWWM
jgi:hypothetical protein